MNGTKFAIAARSSTCPCRRSTAEIRGAPRFRDNTMKNKELHSCHLSGSRFEYQTRAARAKLRIVLARVKSNPGNGELVSNEVFLNEQSGVPGCVYNGSSEDATNIVNPNDHSTKGSAAQMSSDTVNFAAFMRF